MIQSKDMDYKVRVFMDGAVGLKLVKALSLSLGLLIGSDLAIGPHNRPRSSPSI